jgi:hypothetical protein
MEEVIVRRRKKKPPVEPVVVPKKGRPKGKKEPAKIVYVMMDPEGNQKEIKPDKISSRDMKKMAVEEGARAKEIELGMKLKRLKNGQAKIPKERSAAQKENDKKLVEFNRQRRMKASQRREVAKTNETKSSLLAALKEVVKLPIKTVTEPTPPPPAPAPAPLVRTFSEW